MFGLSFRMTMRDWRAGELRFLMVALIVAVAALSAVGFFTDRMRSGLSRDAHQLLGADLVINTDQPLPAEWEKQAQAFGLHVAHTVAFPSMAIAGESEDPQAKLTAIKAVSSGYPLRGALKLEQAGGEAVTKSIPANGTVWVDPDLLEALGLAVGDALKLGDMTFHVAAVITAEPDRGASFLNFAPRVMIALSDLPATHLVQDGSRVTYRFLIAGNAGAVTRMQQWAQQKITEQNIKGTRIESLESGNPEMRATLDRAERFLSLVSLLSAMLAAVAIAMATRRFMLRHLDACAMLRCLGLTQREVMVLYLLEFLMIGIAASALGVILGFSAHFVLLQGLGKLAAFDLPAASALPALQGGVTGLLLLIGFALPPILQLRDVPHNHVIRREQSAPKVATVLTYGLGAVTFFVLLLWQAGSITLGLLTAAGFAGGLLVFAVTGWLVLKGVQPLHALVTSSSWRLALSALRRRRGAAVIQIVALALGLMALLLLTVIRAELVSAWQKSMPPDAPNHFIINIQPDQKQEIAQRLQQQGIADAALYPMIRGRLVRINGEPVTAQRYPEDRARRLVEREFNLSTMRDVPTGNRIVAGHWYDDRSPQASVEVGLAETLGLKLGDRVVFQIGGDSVETTITSLRKLDWGSMRVNFFVILNPASVRDLPVTWITAFHLPQHAGAFTNTLVQDFPNLTVIDARTIIREIKAVMDQVIAAVEFLFLFSLVAGVLVLYAALVGSQDERVREAGLLRALGATRSQLSRAQMLELILIGGVAGLLSATGAAAVGWALATQIFNFGWSLMPAVWVVGIAAGIGCALLGGWIGLRGVLSHPPLYTLRQA